VLIGYAAAVVAAGCVAYYGVEEPGRRLLRRLTARAEKTTERPPVEVALPEQPGPRR
jgi:peptidoglycan/LPS O-acetylase OafA/YrhL